MHHRDAGDRVEVTDRPAVEPHRLAGRQHDVAGDRRRRRVAPRSPLPRRAPPTAARRVRADRRRWPRPADGARRPRTCGRGRAHAAGADRSRPVGSSNGVRNSITSDSAAAAAERSSPTICSGDSSAAASTTILPALLPPGGRRGVGDDRVPAERRRTAPAVPAGRSSGRPWLGAWLGDRLRTVRAEAQAPRARPSTARTSAGRAWAPPQYTHEITPVTITTGCDNDGVRQRPRAGPPPRRILTVSR